MADTNLRVIVEAVTRGQEKIGAMGKSLGGLGDSAKRAQQQFAQAFTGRLPAQLGFLDDAIGQLPVGLLAAGGAALTAGAALVKLGMDTVNAAIEFDKLSQKTGTSVEFLSGLGAVVRDADVDIGAFNTGLVKFADNLFTLEGAGANVEARLLELADLFAQMPDGAEKTALAINAFGRSGAELIPVLNEGSAGIKALMGDAQAMGRVMSQDTVAAAKALDDQLDMLNGRVEGLKLTLGSAIVPILGELAGSLATTVDESSKFNTQMQLISDTFGAGTAIWAMLRDEVEQYALAAEQASGKSQELAQAFDLTAINAEYNALATKQMADAAGLSAAEADRLAKLQAVLNKAVTDGAPAAEALAQSLLGVVPAANSAGIAALLSGQKAQLAAGFWRDAAGVIINSAAQIAGARYAGLARDEFVKQNNAQSKLIPTQDKLKQKGADLTAAYRKQYDQIQANVSANERYGRSWDDLTAKLGGGGGAIQKIDEQLKSLEDRARTVQGALGGGGATFSKNEKLQTAYAIATGELTAEQFQLQQAIKAVVAANESGALSTEQALTAALSASQGLASVQDLFTLAGDAGAPFKAAADEIVAAAGKATTKINTMKTALEELPPGVAVDIAATIKNMDQVRELKGQIEYLDQHDRHTIIIDVVYRTTGAPPPPTDPPGKALGGPAFGWTWVGERGPELVYFGQPGRVFSNTQSKQIAGGGEGVGGGIVVNVNGVEINTDLDVRTFAWRVADEIQRRRR